MNEHPRIRLSKRIELEKLCKELEELRYKLARTQAGAKLLEKEVERKAIQADKLREELKSPPVS